MINATVVKFISGQLHSSPTQEESEAIMQESDVSISARMRLSIRPDTPIFQKLHITTVALTEATDPVVSVTEVQIGQG